VLSPSTEFAVTHADPHGALRRILARALGGEARAALVLAAVVRATGWGELPAQGDELLALLERHLHVELRGRLGSAEAQAVMDEIASTLVARVAKERGPEVVERRTTIPPGVEKGLLKKTAIPPPLGDAPPPVNTMRPPAVEQPPSKSTRRPPAPSLQPRRARTTDRRSVLVIDRDVLARANVSRALAREGCAVTARDSCAGISGGGLDDYDVVVTEVANVEIDELIEAMAQSTSACVLVAWTSSAPAARALFGAAGVSDAAVIEKGPRPDELVAAVRASLG
jgi:CheY-like chemotaxis protein